MGLQQALAQFDRSNMLERVLNIPEQLARAWASNQNVQVSIDAARIRNILVCGMGGSAISGDVIRSLVEDQLQVPFLVNRSYDIPPFVDSNSLVFISSYSGDTEETLSAYRQARERGANIICITGGGVLRASAQEAGYPIFSLPDGYPPRSALVFLTIPILQSLLRIGLIEFDARHLDEAIAVLKALRERYQPAQGPEHNIPLIIAGKVAGKIPIVYAGTGLLEAAATRWRGQFSENAEMLAYGNVFSEMNHNEIVGWGIPDAQKQKLQCIYLRDRDDHPRIKLRMDIVREIIEETSNPVLEVWSEGESLLARLFSVIFTGDLASVYAAVQNEIDPTPVKKIDHLKEILAARQ